MADGDMRYGRCGACGCNEVYQGEYVAQGGLRRTGAGAYGAKPAVFAAFICAACGHAQLHVLLDEKTSSHIRKKLDRVPPQPRPN